MVFPSLLQATVAAGMVEMVLFPNLAANVVMPTKVSTTMARALFMHTESLYTSLCKVVKAAKRRKSNTMLYSSCLASYGAGRVAEVRLPATQAEYRVRPHLWIADPKLA